MFEIKIDLLLKQSRNYPFIKSDFVNERDKYLNTANDNGLISFDNIVDNAPLFDYFILWDITNKKENDWILLDIYSQSDALALHGFFISNKFKNIIEKFNIETPHKFYPSKLMFQGEKLDYYIFQMAWDEWAEYDFEKSAYFEKINNEWVKLYIEVTNSKEFRKIYKLWDQNNEKYKMKLVLKKKYDIFYFQYIGFVISEELKRKIETEKITGLEISTYKNIEFEFI